MIDDVVAKHIRVLAERAHSHKLESDKDKVDGEAFDYIHRLDFPYDRQTLLRFYFNYRAFLRRSDYEKKKEGHQL